MPPGPSSPGYSPRIVDLFAGPGGLDVGAAWLGVSTIGIELDANACATRAAAGLDTVQGDVRGYGPEDFPDATVLTGGPPCQTFTVAGTGSGRRSLEGIVECIARMADSVDANIEDGEFADERTRLVLEPMRWALSAMRSGRPYEAIVLEQVPAVLPIWEAFGSFLAQHGYGVDHGILRTEEFGVPQTRRRAILIARLDADIVTLPEPTHQVFRKGSRVEAGRGLQPWVPMSSALRRGSTFTVVSNYGSGGNPRNRGLRHSDEPAATVTGKVMRNRIRMAGGGWSRLSYEEAGALQTFPHDFPWRGSDIGQQIGNAIPPRLAVHVLARALSVPFEESALDSVVGTSWADSKRGALTPLQEVVEGVLAASE